MGRLCVFTRLLAFRGIGWSNNSSDVSVGNQLSEILSIRYPHLSTIVFVGSCFAVEQDAKHDPAAQFLTLVALLFLSLIQSYAGSAYFALIFRLSAKTTFSPPKTPDFAAN
jgi:hypothetical protein